MTDRREPDQPDEVSEKDDEASPSASRRARGGLPQQPVEKAVVVPPETREVR